MRNYKEILNKTSDTFQKSIISNGGIEIETENFGWINHRYVSSKFRIAHIERYSDGKIEVLHVTTFPKETSTDPIFGFDIITTEDKPLAAFFDWSPVLNDKTYEKNNLEYDLYQLPDWALNIFSKNAIAIIPKENEVNNICDLATESFKTYLEILTPNNSNELEKIKQKQNYYCEQQQQNKRTYNVLKSKLGEDRAKYFMENILFPKIK
jgi:phycocyanobilin:ferredoxin oxidoreductase